jgi:hypothetical protein
MSKGAFAIMTKEVEWEVSSVYIFYWILRTEEISVLQQ